MSVRSRTQLQECARCLLAVSGLLALNANLAPNTKKTMCGFVGLTLLFRKLVIGWWYLDLHLLKCVLILTVGFLVSCSLSFKLMLCSAQDSLPMFCAHDGKSDSRVVFGLLTSIIDVYVQHVGAPGCVSMT